MTIATIITIITISFIFIISWLSLLSTALSTVVARDGREIFEKSVLADSSKHSDLVDYDNFDGVKHTNILNMTNRNKTKIIVNRHPRRKMIGNLQSDQYIKQISHKKIKIFSKLLAKKMVKRQATQYEHEHEWFPDLHVEPEDTISDWKNFVQIQTPNTPSLVHDHRKRRDRHRGRPPPPPPRQNVRQPPPSRPFPPSDNKFGPPPPRPPQQNSRPSQGSPASHKNNFHPPDRLPPSSHNQHQFDPKPPLRPPEQNFRPDNNQVNPADHHRPRHPSPPGLHPVNLHGQQQNHHHHPGHKIGQVNEPSNDHYQNSHLEDQTIVGQADIGLETVGGYLQTNSTTTVQIFPETKITTTANSSTISTPASQSTSTTSAITTIEIIRPNLHPEIPTMKTTVKVTTMTQTVIAQESTKTVDVNNPDKFSNTSNTTISNNTLFLPPPHVQIEVTSDSTSTTKPNYQPIVADLIKATHLNKTLLSRHDVDLLDSDGRFKYNQDDHFDSEKIDQDTKDDVEDTQLNWLENDNDDDVLPINSRIKEDKILDEIKYPDDHRNDRPYQYQNSVNDGNNYDSQSAPDYHQEDDYNDYGEEDKFLHHNDFDPHKNSPNFPSYGQHDFKPKARNVKLIDPGWRPHLFEDPPEFIFDERKQNNNNNGCDTHHPALNGIAYIHIIIIVFFIVTH